MGTTCFELFQSFCYVYNRYKTSETLPDLKWVDAEEDLCWAYVIG